MMFDSVDTQHSREGTLSCWAIIKVISPAVCPHADRNFVNRTLTDIK